MSILNTFIGLHNLTWQTRSPLLLGKNNDPEKGPPRFSHLKANEYLQYNHITPDKYHKYFKFAFVRNPWDRAVSLYYYLGFSKRIEFGEFARKMYTGNIWQEKYWFVGPQHEFVCKDNGDPAIDFIGRYETLQSDFGVVTDKLGIDPITLPEKNISKRRLGCRYRDIYSGESKVLIYSLYKKDIEIFGYEF